MYAVMCLFVIALVVWGVFIFRVILNIRRDQEVKFNNQAYYNLKIKQLNGKKDQEAETSEETIDGI